MVRVVVVPSGTMMGVGTPLASIWIVINVLERAVMEIIAFVIPAARIEDNPSILVDGSDVSSVTPSNSLLPLIRWLMLPGYQKLFSILRTYG